MSTMHNAYRTSKLNNVQRRRLTAADFSLVLLLQDVCRVKIEMFGGPLVCAAELGVASVTDRHIAEPAVNDQIDERCAPRIL